MSETKETTFETPSNLPVNHKYSIFWENKSSPLYVVGFPGGSDGKEATYNAGDLGSILGLRRTPGEGNG